ncbi:MAG: type VII toxin-antitoxin system MntA family adenylyltransferase antitoxin [Candidatus Woesearchaeota archaeon]
MNNRTKSNLRKIARKYDLLLFVYFGSRVKNEETKESDYDFAFYNKEKISEVIYLQLKKDIYYLLNTSHIDLIDLNREDDPVLRYEIFKDGICIYEKYKGIFEKVQTDSWFNYIYYKPYLEEQRKFLKKSLQEMNKW